MMGSEIVIVILILLLNLELCFVFTIIVPIRNPCTIKEKVLFKLFPYFIYKVWKKELKDLM